jgi:sugar lactone lactonase YvrE
MDTYGNLYVSDMFNYRIMKYTNTSLASASLPIVGQVVAGGSYGISYNQQEYSYGVAVDTLGNVFVSDYWANRVMKWVPQSTTGALVAGIGNGTAGNGTNQLLYPMGIYIDQYMALYIADAGNARIQKWLSGSSTGTTVAGANGQLSFPTDVYVDTYGTIYTFDSGALYRFYPGSTSGTIVISTYTISYGFKFDSVGNVYITDYLYNKIRKYSVNSTNCGGRMATIPLESPKFVSVGGLDARAMVQAEIEKVQILPRDRTTSH